MNKVQKFARIVAKELLEDLSNWFEEIAENKFESLKTDARFGELTDEQIERIEKFCKGPIENARMDIDTNEVKKMIHKQWNLKADAAAHFDWGKTFNENIVEYERKRKQINQNYCVYCDCWDIQNYDNLKWMEYFVEWKLISFEQYKV